MIHPDIPLQEPGSFLPMYKIRPGMIVSGHMGSITLEDFMVIEQSTAQGKAFGNGVTITNDDGVTVGNISRNVQLRIEGDTRGETAGE